MLSSVTDGGRLYTNKRFDWRAFEGLSAALLTVPAGWSIKALSRLGSMGCWRGAPGSGNIPTRVSQYSNVAISIFPHTRQLGLLCSDIFVAWWLDIPLCQAPFALQDGYNISQIRCWFLLFWRWTSAFLSVL